MADPGFPQSANSKGAREKLLFGPIFSPKMYENKRNWTERGRAVLEPLLDPPMGRQLLR